MERAEKRFDVKVPLSNTVLLELLARESELTGIVESRLLVQYATLYAEMRKGMIPIMAPGIAFPAAPLAPNGQQTAGQSQRRDPASQTQEPALDSAALDALFGDPD